jgi:hypothetical protein
MMSRTAVSALLLAGIAASGTAKAASSTPLLPAGDCFERFHTA